MKNIYATIIFLITILNASAQWSGDPANPAIVCNATNGQATVRALHDGNGGYYVFWRDDRTNATTTGIYGQRYDANGIAQWATNGKLIYSPANRDVNYFHVIRNFQGNLFFGISQGLTNSGDTIVVYKTDSAGDAMWAQPTVVAGRLPGVIYTADVLLSEKDTGVYVGFFIIHTGGSEDLHVNRVDNNGNNLWGFNGFTVPNSGYGGFGMIPDGVGGLYLYWRNGNGAGTGLGVRRMTEDGTFLWTGNVNPAGGTPGLGYEYDATSDGHNGVLFTWVENGSSSIRIARIDSSGSFVWNPTILPACEAPSGQAGCRIIKNGNYFYVAWTDNRPPASNADVYMQRFDMNGAPQWTIDGIRCTSSNTYIAYTQLLESSNGSIIFSVNGNVAAGGFLFQKINPDSTLAWPGIGTRIANYTFNPGSTDYVMLTSADSGTVVFWAAGGNIYTARVNSNGTMTGITEAPDKRRLTLYPNPANEQIYIEYKEAFEGDALTLIISDATGQVVFESASINILSDHIIVDTNNLTPGFYTAALHGRKTFAISKFIINR
ncbi:MAG: T9SS type A sorting domain-containing protein [Bacteroidota bacterium]